MTSEPIWFRLPPPSTRYRSRRRARSRPPCRDHHRRPGDRGGRGLHHSRRLPRRGHRGADALLPRDADAGQRVPRLRRRAGGRARPRAGLLAPDRAGMVIRTRSPRVDLSRKLVLELLASSVDLSTAPTLEPMMREYGADPSASARHALSGAATVAQRPKIDNELYMRDYSQVRALLQVRRGLRHRRAAHVRDRRRRPRLRRAHLDRVRRDAARVGLCLLRQLHRGLPDRRADADARVRAAQGRGMAARDADRHRHDLPLLRRRAARSRVHVQDQRIVKVTSPLESEVTHGNLCVKGRFGFEYVNKS